MSPTPPSHLSKSEVQQKLKSGDLILSDPKSSKSPVWKTMGLVSDKKGNILPWAACRNQRCFEVYTFSGSSSGTSTLVRHKCSSTAAPAGQPAINTVLPSTNELKDGPRCVWDSNYVCLETEIFNQAYVGLSI